MKNAIFLFFFLCVFNVFYSQAQCSIDAGTDAEICSNSTYFANPLPTGSLTSFTWTSSGTGTFDNPNGGATFYNPSQADIALGSVQLTITADGCGLVTDVMTLTISPQPIIYAGPDIEICPSNDSVYLHGSLNGTNSSITWTSNGGTGYFIGGITSSLNAVYFPSYAESDAGLIYLTMKANKPGCRTVFDTVVVTFKPKPMVNAGPDQVSACTMDQDVTVPLAGTFSAASGMKWSASVSGTFIPNNTDPNAVFTTHSWWLPDSDIIIFTATTNKEGKCLQTNDEVLYTRKSIQPPYLINDQIACSSGISITMEGGVRPNTIWTSTNGSGNFSSTSSNVYTLAAADRLLPYIEMVSELTNSNGCPSMTDTVLVFLTSEPATVDLGPDLTTCTDYVRFKATYSHAYRTLVSNNTTVPNDGSTGYYRNDYDSTHQYEYAYYFTPDEVAAGIATITFSAVNVCQVAAQDQITVTKYSDPLPIVDPGNYQQINDADRTVHINATFSNCTGIIWSSTGSGTFLPDNTSPTATYIPSPQDEANRWVYLIATSTGSEFCQSVQNSIGVGFDGLYTLTGGVVYATTDSLDFGYVELFKKHGNSFDYLDTDTIAFWNKNPYYFPGLTSGEYLVLATPSNIYGTSVYEDSYVPTYAGNVIEWSNAQILTITDASIIGPDISLIPFNASASNWNSGTDVISGTLSIAPPSIARVEAGETAIANALVYLALSNSTVVAYTYTDQNGKYSFTNVAAGTYKVMPQVVGLYSTPITVTVDGNPATREDASIHTSPQPLTTGLLSTQNISTVSSFPNPTRSNVSVALPSTASGTAMVKLMHESGALQLEKEMTLNNNTITLDIEHLPAGLYVIQINTGDQLYTSKIVKF